MRTLAFWLLDNIPLGRLAPWVFGIAIGRKPVKVSGKSKQEEKCLD